MFLPFLEWWNFYGTRIQNHELLIQESVYKQEIVKVNVMYLKYITKHKYKQIKRRTAIPYTHTTRTRRNTDQPDDRSKKNSKEKQVQEGEVNSDNDWKDFEADMVKKVDHAEEPRGKNTPLCEK